MPQNLAEMAFRFGNQPSLGTKVAALQGQRTQNALGQHALATSQADQARAGQVREAMPGAMQGDPNALQSIAGADPDFYMQLTEKMAAMDEATRKQVAEEAEQLGRWVMMNRDNPEALAQRNITPEQVPMIESRAGMVSKAFFDVLQKEKEFSNVQADPATGQFLGMQGGQMREIPGAQKTPAPVKDPAVSAHEQKVESLMASGITDRPLAEGIASGRYVTSRHPITGEATIVDKAQIGGQAPGMGAQQAPGEGRQIKPMVPEGVRPDLATGVSGKLTGAVNILTDAVGAGLASPKAREARATLDMVQVLTMSLLQSEVPGRPSNFLLQRLEKLTVAPNSLLEGSAGARTQISQTADLIEGEIDRIELDVLPLDLTPKVRVETQLNLTQLKRLHEAHKDLLRGFDQKGASTPPPAGVDPAVWDAMPPEHRRLFQE